MPASSPQNPLHDRYASREMARIFSADHRYSTWRRLWIALAECQAELGLPISRSQLHALHEAAPRLDLARVAELERQTRHDVVAHLRHFAEQAGEAGGILHLGATSAFITDNADLVARQGGPGAPRTPAGHRGSRAGRLRPADQGHPDPRLHPLSAGPAHHRRQAGLHLAPGLRARPRGAPLPPGPAPVPGGQGDDGNPGELHDAFPRRPGQGPPARPAPRRATRIRRQLRRDRPDLSPQAGQPAARRRSPGSPRAATRWERTSGCSKASESSPSRSTPTRSAPRRWPTSATRCGPSGSAPWPAG